MQKIAIQGYEGCFHHIAAIDYFGRDIEIVPCDTFRAVATSVKSGKADIEPHHAQGCNSPCDYCPYIAICRAAEERKE